MLVVKSSILRRCAWTSDPMRDLGPPSVPQFPCLWNGDEAPNAWVDSGWVTVPKAPTFAVPQMLATVISFYLLSQFSPRAGSQLHLPARAGRWPKQVKQADSHGDQEGGIVRAPIERHFCSTLSHSLGGDRTQFCPGWNSPIGNSALHCSWCQWKNKSSMTYSVLKIPISWLLAHPISPQLLWTELYPPEVCILKPEPPVNGPSGK